MSCLLWIGLLLIVDLFILLGTVQWWDQIPRNATHETVPRYGATFGRRKNGGGACASLCYPQVSIDGIFYRMADNRRFLFPATSRRLFSFSTRLTPHLIIQMWPRLPITFAGMRLMNSSSSWLVLKVLSMREATPLLVFIGTKKWIALER